MLTANQVRLRLLAPWTWARAYVTEGLRMMGLLPEPEPVHGQVEHQFAAAMTRVAAPADFRRELATNLALVAQHKSAGFVITRPKPYRLGILLGVGAGAVATAAAILALVLRSRIERRAQS